jgi:hypothetical protein
LLQGRIPKSVFVRHYYKPDLARFEKVRSLLDNLYNQLMIFNNLISIKWC